MRKYHVFLSALFALLILSSCSINAEQQAKLNAEIEKSEALGKELVVLGDKLDAAHKKYEAGKLTAAEFKELAGEVKDKITYTKDEIVKTKDAVVAIQKEGVGWLEIAGATLIGILTRGVPSKGPLGMLFGVMAARRKED